MDDINQETGLVLVPFYWAVMQVPFRELTELYLTGPMGEIFMGFKICFVHPAAAQGVSRNLRSQRDQRGQ